LAVIVIAVVVIVIAVVVIVVVITLDPLAVVGIVAAVSIATLAAAACLLVADRWSLVEITSVLIIPESWAAEMRWLGEEAIIAIVTVWAIWLVSTSNNHFTNKPLSVLLTAPVSATASIEHALVHYRMAFPEDLVVLVLANDSNWDAVLSTAAAVLVAIVAWASSRGARCWLLSGPVIIIVVMTGWEVSAAVVIIVVACFSSGGTSWLLG
jgi:hypothetical protein